MLEVFTESAIIAITGSIMALLGNILYSTNGHSFVSGGRFQSKDQATVIILLSIISAALVSLLVEMVVRQIITTISLLSTTGVLIVMLRLTVNMLVRRWNPFDDASLGLYALGSVLFLVGYYF